MSVEYSVDTCRALAGKFRSARIERPMRVGRYDAGDELSYEVTGVAPATAASVRLAVERFVGGGFAGQVYRVKVLTVEDGQIAGLEVGGSYAMKVLIPPSGRARVFRDALYWLGFGGAFSLQVNPAAARAGAIWQKLIRRAADIRFGTERAVVDVLGTFVDATLGSCGEISEWIDGRTWRFEVDDHLEVRKAWSKGRPVRDGRLGSAEYRAKKAFMAELVRLLHDMGAPELARQYEWATCKSQPNVLKRLAAGDDPEAGLTAVDFRAGLALLPLLPMSPGDFRLIGRGIARGSLVQFDRGDLRRLDEFIGDSAGRFADLDEAVAELKSLERVYRDSLPDVTHHHVRLLYDQGLWSGILAGARQGWETRNLVDARAAAGLRRSAVCTMVFAMIGIVPLLGRAVRRLWGRADYGRHYARVLTSPDYFRRAFRARMAEKLIAWHRKGRVSERQALGLSERPGRFLGHVLLSVLPAFLHRMLTDRAYAAAKLAYVFVRPVRLYFNAGAREQWLRDMIAEGRKNHTLTDEDADRIVSRVGEPFIQKYLKSLAVHVCTLPVTQIVSGIVAVVYWLKHPEQSPEARSLAVGAILLAFQVTPISPGSLVRGLYVLYLVIRERNFKDYNIAVFLGFFKYVGYLAFPIQMAQRYPALARFMAGHWSTGAAHVLPVFGERGALLEHGVFDLFYNRPLTVRRQMRRRAERRAALRPRSWHAVAIAAAGAAAFVAADLFCLARWTVAPTLGDVWFLVLAWPPLAGMLVTRWAGGTSLPRRFVQAAGCGAVMGLLYGLAGPAGALIAGGGRAASPLLGSAGKLAGGLLWRMFLFGILAAVGAILKETSMHGVSADQTQPVAAA